MALEFMATLLNLKTNESVELSSYSDSNPVIIPAIVQFWGASDVAFSHQGIVTRGKCNSPEIISALCMFDRGLNEQLFRPMTQRPPVVNGQRLFAIKDARAS